MNSRILRSQSIISEYFVALTLHSFAAAGETISRMYLYSQLGASGFENIRIDKNTGTICIPPSLSSGYRQATSCMRNTAGLPEPSDWILEISNNVYEKGKRKTLKESTLHSSQKSLLRRLTYFKSIPHLDGSRSYQRFQIIVKLNRSPKTYGDRSM